MENERAGPGLAFRWTRRVLLLIAALIFLSWLITITGLYFWFNVGPEDRFRFEYGRIVWRHVDGGTAHTYAGVDGGASRAHWTFKSARYDTHRITTIPLWMPFLFFVGTTLGMTLARRIRSRVAVKRLLDDPPEAERQRDQAADDGAD